MSKLRLSSQSAPANTGGRSSIRGIECPGRISAGRPRSLVAVGATWTVTPWRCARSTASSRRASSSPGSATISSSSRSRARRAPRSPRPFDSDVEAAGSRASTIVQRPPAAFPVSSRCRCSSVSPVPTRAARRGRPRACSATATRSCTSRRTTISTAAIDDRRRNDRVGAEVEAGPERERERQRADEHDRGDDPSGARPALARCVQPRLGEDERGDEPEESEPVCCGRPEPAPRWRTSHPHLAEDERRVHPARDAGDVDGEEARHSDAAQPERSEVGRSEGVGDAAANVRGCRPVAVARRAHRRRRARLLPHRRVNRPPLLHGHGRAGFARRNWTRNVAHHPRLSRPWGDSYPSATSRNAANDGFRSPEAVSRPEFQRPRSCSSFSRNQSIMSIRGVRRAIAYACLR